MALKPGLRVHQSQRLALTPGLRQSLSILQMSAAELSNMVERALEENPVLSVEQNFPTNRQSFDHSVDLVADQKSLAETLRDQIGLMNAPRRTRQMAEYLTGDLTEDGYLAEPAESYCELFSAELYEIDAAIALLQACDPVGIGARSLADCLDLQMVARNIPAADRQLVLDNLADFGAERWQNLQRKTGQSKKRLSELAAILHNLDPTPGRQAGPASNHVLIPDVQVLFAPPDSFTVESIGATTPSLTVDLNAYRGLRAEDQEARDYLAERSAQAKDLIRAIESRSAILLRVAQAIVGHQREFFTKGHDHLQPLTQNELAAAMELHPSTITRAIANKSLTCDFGTFPLKFFFSSQVNSLYGEEAVSAYVIKQKIRRFIANESAENVLSDEAIRRLLHESGVDISRRTVAKYRQCLKISSSAQRRRSKRHL